MFAMCPRMRPAGVPDINGNLAKYVFGPKWSIFLCCFITGCFVFFPSFHPVFQSQVTLYRAQNLKKVQLIGKQDPYVRAKLLYRGRKV